MIAQIQRDLSFTFFFFPAVTAGPIVLNLKKKNPLLINYDYGYSIAGSRSRLEI